MRYSYIPRILDFFKKSRWSAPVFFFLLTISIFWPVVLGGQMFARDFAMVAQAPELAVLARGLKAGTLPLWTSGYFSGFPVYLTQIGWFNPLQALLLWALELFDAYTLFVFLSFFLALMLTYAFSRALELSRAASMLTAVVFMTSQLVLFWSPLNTFAGFYPLIPLFFLSILRISQRRRTVYFALLGVATLAVGFVGAFIELTFSLLVAGALFAFFLDATHFQKGRVMRNFRTTLLLVLIIAATAVVINPVLVNGYAFLQLTKRAGGFQIAEQRLQPLDLVRLVYPAFDIPFLRQITGQDLNEYYLFIGTLPLALIAAFFLARSRRLAAYFFAGLALFILLLQFQSFHIWQMLRKLPVFGLFRGAWKWMFLVNFSAALLAGFGLDEIGRFARSQPLKTLTRIFGICVTAVFGIAVLSNIGVFFFKERLVAALFAYFDGNIYQVTAQFPLAFYHERLARIAEKIFAVVSLANPAFLAALFSLAASALLLRYFQSDKISFARFRLFAVGLVAVSAVLIYQQFFFLMPKQEIRTTPVVAQYMRLHEQKQSQKLSLSGNIEVERMFRVHYFKPTLSQYAFDFGLDISDDAAIARLNKELLVPNSNLFFDIDLIDGHEHITDRRQELLVETIYYGTTYDSDREREAFFASDIKKRLALFSSEQNQRLLSMMNVKYILSSYEFFIPAWVKVHQTTLTAYHIPLYVYENTAVLPRVYFAEHVAIIPSEERNDDEATFKRLLAIKDFRRTTLLECNGIYCAHLKTEIGRNDIILFDQLSPGFARVKTRSTHPRWLVYSESNLPTWEARIDGRPTDIHTANYQYQAVYVPAGEHEVEFRYPGILTQVKYSLENLLNNERR